MATVLQVEDIRMITADIRLVTSDLIYLRNLTQNFISDPAEEATEDEIQKEVRQELFTLFNTCLDRK